MIKKLTEWNKTLECVVVSTDLRCLLPRKSKFCVEKVVGKKFFGSVD